MKNKTILVGKDPEVRIIESGANVATFSLATNNIYELLKELEQRFDSVRVGEEAELIQALLSLYYKEINKQTTYNTDLKKSRMYPVKINEYPLSILKGDKLKRID